MFKRSVVLTAVVLQLITTCLGNFANPGALVSYLKSIAGSHTISGQFIEEGPLTPIVAIHGSTGQWLGLIGGDYWWFGETDFQGSYGYNQYAIDYWEGGGIVTLSCSMPNPTTGGAVYDVSDLNVNDLFTNGTTTNDNFMTLLNTVAVGIQQLQKAGVVVIWRPFHENNGNWFWWGTSFLSDQQFVQMWQMTYNYMTNTMGLNNIAWLWAINSGDGDLSRYPGSQYADIVGHDLYTSDPTQGQTTYQALTSLGSPVVLAEFGPGSPQAGDTSFNETDLITAIQQTMPYTVLWQQWWDGNGNNVGWGMAECQDVSQALNNLWVINRDQLGQ